MSGEQASETTMDEAISRFIADLKRGVIIRYDGPDRYSSKSLGEKVSAEVAKRLTAALATRDVTEEPVAVKPLEWEDYPDDGSVMYEGTRENRQYLERTVHSFGAYCLMYKHGEGYSVKSDYTRGTEYGTAADARSAAQADFESRILSAISARPLPLPSEEKMREARNAALEEAAGLLDEESDYRVNSSVQAALEQAAAAVRALKTEGESR